MTIPQKMDKDEENDKKDDNNDLLDSSSEKTKQKLKKLYIMNLV